MLYALLFCLLYFATTECGGQLRFDFYDDYYKQLFENDPNLNEGFDMEAFRQHQLDLHNYYRHLHEVPSMTLDSTLTQQAQAYAEELALKDSGLVHCYSLSGCDYGGAGENLASAEGYTEVEANASIMWYREIWDYNFCTTGTLDRHRPGHEGHLIGHFTQLVWETSTLLGVGYARTSDKYKVYVVARYLAHGNVIGHYDRYVKRPAYVLNTFQDNCYGIDGGLSDWTGPGPCTRNCGGGVRFFTKSCTNPKPSLNGRDCEGVTKELVREWCNSQVCSGDLSHRDLQCAARGEMADAHNFRATRDCQLHCRISKTHFLLVGHVDDGTHCNYGSGACVDGVCYDMPDYVVRIQPPSTSAATKSIINETTTEQPGRATTNPTAIPTTASTTQTKIKKPTPSAKTPTRKLVTGAFSENLIERFQRLLSIPSEATDIVVQNNKPRNARIEVKFQKRNQKPTRYKKRYGQEMMPFFEQVGRGNINILPMVSIEGPVKPGFKVIVNIYRKRKQKHTPYVTWRYWAEI